ncbi:hypothetical protein VCRA213O314_760015 [Vibrio crassostreae]|nr:hypothetical protein VCRA213O314_760015 [Vibrio crassostreae]
MSICLRERLSNNHSMSFCGYVLGYAFLYKRHKVDLAFMKT